MDPNDELTVGNFEVLPDHSFENWTDWNSWEASTEIQQAFPYYRSGYDYEGRVGQYSLTDEQSFSENI